MDEKFNNWINTPTNIITKDGTKEGPTILEIAKQYQNNCKADKRSNCRYPIYIASVQGGGIYAAYHTAKTFQTITANIPNFRNHLFAISSVSGGSFGSVIYANWLRNCSYKYDKIDKVDSFFDRPRDPLALIVASMFLAICFNDFTRFLWQLGTVVLALN